jgi:hypothetical protein
MNEFLPDTNRDELDRQIRAALETDVSSQQVARLESFWHRESRAKRRRRRLAVASVLAASILVSVTASLIWHSPLASRDPVAIRPALPMTDRPPVSEPPVIAPSPDEELPRTTVRPPTAYERFVFVARSAKTTGRPSGATIVASVLEQLALEPAADVDELVRTSGLSKSAMERLLLRRLARASHEEILACLRCLAICGSTRSSSPLLRLARQAEFRDETLTTLERIVGVAGLPELACRSSDLQVRTSIYRWLLTRGDDASLSVYLTLIHDSVLRAEAIAVADDVSGPLLTKLLNRLDDEDEDVRLTAALVLGHANGPTVTRELIRRVTDPERRVGSREAWIALLACRDAQAEAFFAFASQQPKLLGSFNRAHMWWSMRIPLWRVVKLPG